MCKMTLEKRPHQYFFMESHFRIGSFFFIWLKIDAADDEKQDIFFLA